MLVMTHGLNKILKRLVEGNFLIPQSFVRCLISFAVLCLRSFDCICLAISYVYLARNESPMIGVFLVSYVTNSRFLWEYYGSLPQEHSTLSKQTMSSRNRNLSRFQKEEECNPSPKNILKSEINDTTANNNIRPGDRDTTTYRRRYSTGRMKSTQTRRNSQCSQFGGSQATTAVSSINASETPSGESSFGGNLWDRLLRPKKAKLWEGYGKDAYADECDSVISVLSDGEEQPRNQCLSLLQDCLNVLGHETRHFVLTVIKHPVVLIGALFIFGLVFGVGYSAIDSQRCASISKSQHTATWIATETAGWFQKQFEDMMRDWKSVV